MPNWKDKDEKSSYFTDAQIDIWNEVRCPEKSIAGKMKKSILDARKKGDSLGGIIESVTNNIPVGLGEPIFRSLESELSKAFMQYPLLRELNLVLDFPVLKNMVHRIMILTHSVMAR